MIQYDRNMNVKEIENYWAGGYVLYKDEELKKWLLAEVRSSSSGNKVRLLLTDINKEIQKEVLLSKRDFFDTVVLHRPQINLVVLNNVLYRLAWEPPDRTANKAISEHQLLLTRMYPKCKFTEETFAPFHKYRENYLKEINPHIKRGLKIPQLKMQQSSEKRLTVLLAALNANDAPAISNRELFKQCWTKIGVPVLVDRDSWIVRQTAEEVEYHVGNILICTLFNYDDHVSVMKWIVESPEFWQREIHSFNKSVNCKKGVFHELHGT